MAALDFPANPTNGQTFVAPNGVTYQWDGTVWRTYSTPVAGGIAFSGVPTSAGGTGWTAFTYSGAAFNIGNYFNPATGRFTPPAGRYHFNVASAITANVNGLVQVSLYKNGAGIKYAETGYVGGGGQPISANLSVIVEANGTDYFEAFGVQAASQGWLGALHSEFSAHGI